VPIVIDSIDMFERDLGTIRLEKEASQVSALLKRMHGHIRIGEDKESSEKHDIEADLSKHRPHANIFETMFTCPRHFGMIESNGSRISSRHERIVRLAWQNTRMVIVLPIDTDGENQSYMLCMQIVFIGCWHDWMIVVDENRCCCCFFFSILR
jgi:hypothetical protein